MFKFFHLSATLAAILSSQIPTNLLATQQDAVNHSLQKNTLISVVNETSNAYPAFTNAENSILTAAPNNTPEFTDKLGSTGTMLAIAAIGGGAVGLILNAKKTKIKTSSTLSPKNTENTVRIDQASRKLQKELLRLLHDDRNTANRLLSQVKSNNPSRSINWCIEKVIYDLERDRGAY